MLSSSLDALLKLSKTTSPSKLFDYDCATLYVIKNFLPPCLLYRPFLPTKPLFTYVILQNPIEWYKTYFLHKDESFRPYFGLGNVQSN